MENFIFAGYLHFPVPGLLLGPRLQPQVLAPNLHLADLALNFYLPALVSPEPWLAYTNLVLPICIY